MWPILNEVHHELLPLHEEWVGGIKLQRWNFNPISELIFQAAAHEHLRRARQPQRLCTSDALRQGTAPRGFYLGGYLVYAV
jgi:hypothetical protein